jgi:hypothetical protein
MTTESGIPNPESGEYHEPKPQALFSCCSTARAFLVASVLVLNKSGSFLATPLGMTAFSGLSPRINEWVRIYCMCSYVLALIASVVGLVIDGVSECGEIVWRGRPLRHNRVGQAFLAVFALPWVLLIAFSWSRR